MDEYVNNVSKAPVCQYIPEPEGVFVCIRYNMYEILSILNKHPNFARKYFSPKHTKIYIHGTIHRIEEYNGCDIDYLLDYAVHQIIKHNLSGELLEILFNNFKKYLAERFEIRVDENCVNIHYKYSFHSLKGTSSDFGRFIVLPDGFDAEKYGFKSENEYLYSRDNN